MYMKCEKCKKSVLANKGEFIYYLDKMIFACSTCAKKLNDEIKCARMACNAIDGKKNQADHVINNKESFKKFMKDIETTIKKIPRRSNLFSDISLLVSLIKSYESGEYRDISYNDIIISVAAILYVVSPVDIIPDVIPSVGFSDDEMVVTFCIKMIHDELEKFKGWDGEIQS